MSEVRRKPAAKTNDKRAQDKQSAGASLQKIGKRKRLSSWGAHHQLVAVETLLRLLKNPLASLLTWMVVAIALTPFLSRSNEHRACKPQCHMI